MRYLLVLLLSVSLSLTSVTVAEELTAHDLQELTTTVSDTILPYLIAAHGTSSILERREYTQAAISYIDQLTYVISTGTPEERSKVASLSKALEVCRNSAVRIWESTSDMRINSTTEIHKCSTVLN